MSTKRNAFMDDHQAGIRPRRGQPLRTLVNVVLSLVLLGAGIVLASYLNNNKPQAAKRASQDVAPWVQVTVVHPARQTVTVAAMGTVVPARELVVKPRVTGQIVALHPDFKPGGRIAAGERIVRIDPEDYRLRLAQKRREVAEARYELKMEQGYQDVAAREWALLGTGRTGDPADAELALRRPHLEKAQAAVAAAEAELVQAERDLVYTEVRAPFNATVRSKETALGAQVSTGDRLAVLVGTDRFWVQVSLPTDRLDWIWIPSRAGEAGSPATVVYHGSRRRPAKVIRLLSELAPEGRMAQVLVAVDDPLGLDSPEGLPPLLIGEFVQLEIQGRTLEGVYRIPRGALHDGRQIWLADADDRLEVRDVIPVWRDRELSPGERLVVSDLAAPAAGMQLRIEPAAGPAHAQNEPRQGGVKP